MPQQHVTVFTTGPGCHLCNLTKKVMKDRKIEFVEVRLDRDPKIAAEFKAKGYTEAPIVRVIRPNGADVTWSGFRITQIDTLVGGAA